TFAEGGFCHRAEVIERVPATQTTSTFSMKSQGTLGSPGAVGHDTIFTLGHSPDPDDAFMFYAIAANKIDLRGYKFEHRLEDIQTLIECAMRRELHISAVSIHACAYVADKYLLLPCGASMGVGYGPLVIEKRRTPNIEPAYAEGYGVAGREHRTSHEDIR